MGLLLYLGGWFRIFICVYVGWIVFVDDQPHKGDRAWCVSAVAGRKNSDTPGITAAPHLPPLQACAEAIHGAHVCLAAGFLPCGAREDDGAGPFATIRVWVSPARHPVCRRLHQLCVGCDGLHVPLPWCGPAPAHTGREHAGAVPPRVGHGSRRRSGLAPMLPVQPAQRPQCAAGAGWRTGIPGCPGRHHQLDVAQAQGLRAHRSQHWRQPWYVGTGHALPPALLLYMPPISFLLQCRA